MAIFRTGPVVGAISGALGSLVFVNGRRSSVVRPRPVKLHKSSPFLDSALSNMSQVRRAWGDLTDLQQDAWSTKAVQIPTTNALGVASPMSGFTLFVRLNLQIANTALPFYDLPPTLPSHDPPVSIILTFSASGNYQVAAVNALFPTDAHWIITGWTFLTDRATRDPARLVFLKTAFDDSISINIRPEWEAHYGPLQEGEQFAIGLATATTLQTRSVVIQTRDEVAA